MNDFEAAIAKSKAYAGKALAILAKFHSDMLDEEAQLDESEIVHTFSEGARAISDVVGYLGCLEETHDRELGALRDKLSEVEAENESLRQAAKAQPEAKRAAKVVTPRKAARRSKAGAR